MIRAVAGDNIKVPRWDMQSLINSLDSWKGKTLTAIFTKGIDLTKNVFLFPAWMHWANLHWYDPMSLTPICAKSLQAAQSAHFKS